MKDPISESLKRLISYFDSKSISYVIVGGVAVIVSGRTRMTNDVDIILNHEEIQREDFVRYLVKEGFDANLGDFDGFDEESHCSIFFKEGMFRIDIKGTYSDLDTESIEMATDEIFNGIPVKINHPINTILFKLKFGSEQDYEDALAVYVRNKEKIDHNFLAKKASKMKIKKELDSFIDEVNSYLMDENSKKQQ
ncbi:MAG: nucleotidyltransferase [Candidatus Heimdallarchaeota archaeon]|nr:nucleotidyltransferase [Candidatus Heimdallarchaeota archaeon]MCK4612610.1 nucleotidyltransferase [Candidatus Heimdallarchaeota archaeon]